MNINKVIDIAIQAGAPEGIKNETGAKFLEKFAVLLIEEVKKEERSSDIVGTQAQAGGAS